MMAQAGPCWRAPIWPWSGMPTPFRLSIRHSKLNPNNADMLADYADALAIHQGRKLEGKPETLIEKALKVDPNHVKR